MGRRLTAKSGVGPDTVARGLTWLSLLLPEKTMLLAHGTFVAVADGEKLNLYRNTGTEAEPKLAPVAAATPDGENKGAGTRHHSSSANPPRTRCRYS